MNKSRSILSLFSVFLLILIMLPSCTKLLPYNGYFDGGKILDDELMSEIRSKYVVEETTEASTAKSHHTSSESHSSHITNAYEPDTEELDDPTVIETETETEKETKAKSETEAKIESTAIDLVYWTENGEVYHTKETCRYLKNKNYISGTVQQAFEKGKERICSSCSK